MIFNRKNYNRYLFNIIKGIMLLFMSLGMIRHVDASNSYRLGSEQELFNMIYHKNNIYRVMDKTNPNVLKFNSLSENDLNLRNSIPDQVSSLLNYDELYANGEFFTIYSDSPLIKRTQLDGSDEEIIDVKNVYLENGIGDQVESMRQGRPYRGMMDITIHTNNLEGSLHSIFYKLPGQLDSIGTDPVLLNHNQDIIGKIHQSKSGDRYLQIDFDETKLDQLGDLQITLPIQVRARPEITPGSHSINFAKNQTQRINIDPYDPGIFSWVDVNQYANQPMNIPRGTAKATKWESDNSFTNFVVAELYPNAIRQKHPNFRGYDTMAFPTFFYGVSDNGRPYYPEEIGLCIDPFHTITQSNNPLFRAQIEDFIENEGAEMLNLSLHMAAWRAETAHDDPIQVVSNKTPSSNIPIRYEETNYVKEKYIRERKDTGRRWMGGGQMASWLFSMKYNRDLNNRIDDIYEIRPGAPEGVYYNTKYFKPVAWGDVDYIPDLTIIGKMREMYKDTSYIEKDSPHLLSKKTSKIVLEIPNDQKSTGFPGFEDVKYTQRDFDHYIDKEASLAASNSKNKFDKCLDIKQEYQDIYEKQLTYNGIYTHYKRSNNVPVKTTQIGEPFTKLEVKVKDDKDCNLNPGDVKLVIRKNTRDFWNDSIGYTASVANGRQFVGMFSIPPSYRPSGVIDFYTGNGAINLVKYDSDNPPSTTNEGTRLEGAEFELYDASIKPPKKMGTYTTKEDGVIRVTGLAPGNYYFIETKPPNGYEPNPNGKYPFTITADTFETIALTQDQSNGQVFEVSGQSGKIIPVLGVPNKRIPRPEGDVEVEKYNSNNPSEKLSEAKFSLYEESSNGELSIEDNNFGSNMKFTRISTKTTDKQGKIKFEHLEYDKAYVLLEAQAPPGYEISDQDRCLFKLTNQGIIYGNSYRCFDNNIWKVPNNPKEDTKITGDVTFTKKGRELNPGQPPNIIGPLQNVEFSIYTAEGVFVTRVLSDDQGNVNSGKLPPGRYYFKEEIPVQGYELYRGYIYFNIEDDGEGSFESHVMKEDPVVYNDKQMPEKGDLVVIKYDADGLGKTLKGAEFKLCKDSPTNNSCIGPKSTNAQGEVPFNDLEFGTYYLIETKAPDGYNKNEEPYKIEVNDRTVATGTIYYSVTNEKTPIRDFKFKKIDKSNKGLPGAEFTLQRKENGVWVDTKYTYITNDSDSEKGEPGEINLDEDKIREIGEGQYRFKETKAPEGYQLPKGNDIYSTEFEIKTDKVVPNEVIMENRRLDHELIVQKTVEHGWASPNNIIFVVQARKGNGKWERFKTESFMTDSQGKIKINNDTAPGLIDSMVTDFEEGIYDEFRLREAIVPPTSMLQDPQYPGAGPEDPGKPGDDFSILIPIKDIKEKGDQGENYKTPMDKPLTLENKLVRYRLSFMKKDSINDRPLSGAEFTLYQYAPGVEPTLDPIEGPKGYEESWVLKPDEKTKEYHKNDLLINRTYILRETKSPENYGARTDVYKFNLDYKYVENTDYPGTGEMVETMFVFVVHENGEEEPLIFDKDYMWDNNVKDKHLSFIDKDGDLKNTALPKIPMTGGTGFTIFSIIGLVFSGFGYLLYLYIEKKLKRSE